MSWGVEAAIGGCFAILFVTVFLAFRAWLKETIRTSHLKAAVNGLKDEIKEMNRTDHICSRCQNVNYASDRLMELEQVETEMPEASERDPVAYAKLFDEQAAAATASLPEPRSRWDRLMEDGDG